MTNKLEAQLRASLWVIIGGVVWLAFAALRVDATTVVVPTDDEMVIGARAIVRGEVLAISTRFDSQRGAVFSYIKIDVSEVWKGTIPSREIVLRIPGGVAGDLGTLIYGVPEFLKGEQVLLYLDTWADGSLKVHHWFLGKYKLDGNRPSSEVNVQRATPGAGVLILGQSRSGLVTDQMQLQSYSSMIRSRIASLAERSSVHAAQHYQDTPIRSRPPELDNPTGAGEPFYPSFTFLSPTYPPRWFEPDTSQSVSFRVSTTPAAGLGLPADGTPAQLISDVQSAMGAWSTVSSSNLRVTYGGNSSGCAFNSQDGTNITFNNCDGYFSASSGCSGILAAGGITLYYSGISTVINGTTFYRVFEADVSFNPYANCHYTTRCQVQEVLTHEIGHALGLGHSSDFSATMYPVAHFDDRCASLAADDADAIRFMYPGSTAPPPVPTPTPTPAPTPTPVPATLTANPNPVQVCDGTGFGLTTLNWSAPGVATVQVRVGSPGGPLMFQGGSSGSAATGKWVTNGIVFHIVNASTGASLAQTTVTLTTNGCAAPTPAPPTGALVANPNPTRVCDGTGLGVTTLSWSVSGVSSVRIHVDSATGPVMAQAGPSGQAQTGKWVRNGQRFFLVNASNGVVLGTATVSTTTSGCGGPAPTPTPPVNPGVLVAAPNPVTNCDGTGLGVTTLSWSVSNASTVDVRVGSPTGALMARLGSSGSATTGKWVFNGMYFYLVNPANSQVLGSVIVGITANGCIIARTKIPGSGVPPRR